MKNPFRIRYAISPLYTGSELPEKHTIWTVMYKKWWQTQWRYILEHEGGLTYPIMFHSKEEAINYFKIIPIN